MSSVDLYIRMGFTRAWAERAPDDPEVGVPWLLRASTMNTMPKRFQREGSFHYTFYNSRVEFMDIPYTVKEYDTSIKIIRIENAQSSLWVSLSDPHLRMVEERHGARVARQPLRALQNYPLPALELSTAAMPRETRDLLRDTGILEQSQLGGDWDFHTGAADGNIWLALLRLSNKNDPSVRFTPPYEQPMPTTSTNITRYRTEIKSKIALYCLCVDNNNFNVHNMLHLPDEDFTGLMNFAGEYANIFEELRRYYWDARNIIRARVMRWKNACISPLSLDRVEYHNGNAKIFLSLTEWSFKPLQSDMQITVVPFYFAVLFNRLFNLTITAPVHTLESYPSALFEEQHALYAWMVATEERGRHLGWWTRRESTGFVWSYSEWGARERGFPPKKCGGVVYTPPGSGKTVIVASLCKERPLKTLIIVSKRTKINYWAQHFADFAPECNVLKLKRNETAGDADVVITTWTIYRRWQGRESFHQERLIIDDAHNAKKHRERVQFLLDIPAANVWLLTNVNNIFHMYRQMLNIPTTHLDSHIIAPACNLEAHLSPVDVDYTTLERPEPHQILRTKFYDNCFSKPKLFDKWYRTVETQPQHVPLIYYASSSAPLGWKPISRTDINVPRVANQLSEPCTICYDNIGTAVITGCNHVFCKTCMERQLEHSHDCPLCRTTIDECTFIPAGGEQYTYDTKTHTWSHIASEHKEIIETCSDNTDMIRGWIDRAKGLTVFVSEHDINLPRSTTFVNAWTKKTCLRTTFKNILKDTVDIRKARTMICFGGVSDEELRVLKRKIQRLKNTNRSKIQICTYT